MHGLLLRVLSQRNNFGRVAGSDWERKGIWAKFQQSAVTFKSTSGGEAKRRKAQRSPSAATLTSPNLKKSAERITV